MKKGIFGEDREKELAGQSGKRGTGVISGKELVGNVKPLGQKEMERLKMEDEEKKQDEIGRLREGGRNVEEEMEVVRQEKRQKEQEEEEFLEKLKKQREAEEQERRVLAAEALMTTNPEKKRKKRGSAFVKKGKGASQADMSATGEVFKKKD